jgi:uncharacterized protein (DUF362 family)
MESFVGKGDRVLLKPNFIAPRSRRAATQTDPAVILAVARLVKDFGGTPIVGDSPAWSNTYGCVRRLKLEEPLRRLGVEVRQLNRPVKRRVGDVEVGISSAALDADVIINLPKFKSHQQLVATFAVKNMFGCVAGKKKAYWHFAKGGSERDFCELLIGIYRLLGPAVTLIDGITAMDGPGPIRGRARPLGWLIGGAEPIACELVCSRLINARPEDFPIIRTARQMGFGPAGLDEVEVVGEGLPHEGCTDFVPAELMPIRFSLPRIIKSVCKQIVLLIRDRKGRARYDVR